MAVLSIAKTFELGPTRRFDAEFFLPERRAATKLLESLQDVMPLGRIASWITQGPTPKFTGKGLPCMNGKNIYYGTATFGETNYVSQRVFEELSAYRLRAGDVVITLKHATKIGRAWIIESKEPKIFTRNVGLIRLKNESPVNPASLLFCIWTKPVQKALDRLATGGTSGQITLAISQLKMLPIPKFTKAVQNELPKLLATLEALMNESQVKYASAQRLLLTRLDLDKYNPKFSLSYTIDSSQARRSQRLDAQFFQPVYGYLEGHLVHKYGATPIGKLYFIDVTTGQYSERYVTALEGRPYIRGTDLQDGTVSTDDLVYIAPEDQVVRIDRKDDGNEVHGKIFDYSSTTIEKLMEDGYRDALIQMGIQSMKDAIIEITKKIGRRKEGSVHTTLISLEKLEQKLHGIEKGSKIGNGHDATIVSILDEFISEVESMLDDVDNISVKDEKTLLRDAAKQLQGVTIPMPLPPPKPRN